MTAMSSSLFTLSWLVPSLIHHVQPASRCTKCVQGGARYKPRRAIHSTRIRTASTSSSDHDGLVHQRHHHPSTDKEQVTTQTFNTAKGRIKIDLSNKSLIGLHQSRGERPYQEDTFSIRSIELPSDEVGRTLQESTSSGLSIADKTRGSTSNSKEALTERNKTSNESTQNGQSNEQTLYCAVFDGHNGSQVSTFLSAHLHERLLTVQQNEANEIVTSYRALGGYMRRYKGGLLSNLVDPPAPRRANKIARELKVEEERLARLDRGEEDPKDLKSNIEEKVQQEDNEKVKQAKKDQKPWNILQRIEAAFLKTDLEIIKTEQEAGSTSTVALLHSLDEPRNPFFGSQELHLILAHCGDTRALLCTVPDGTAVRLTETHHPEARSETDRLMRIRTGAVTDSFGESRWAGSLANTRAFGDAHYKALGVFSEPQLVSEVIKGSENAFLILLSDGVTEVLSDQEICDLASREYTNPSHAARNVISFAESVGAQDNLTCLIVPLAGWGKVKGSDSTKARRELRLANYEGRSNRQNRM